MNHISPSQLDQFESCQVRWFKIYVQGQRQIPGFALMQGSSFHFAENEVNFKEKINTGKDQKMSVVTDAFVQNFQERTRQRKAFIANEKIQPIGKDAEIKPKDAEKEGLKALKFFHKESAPTIQPTHAELPGEVEINGLTTPYSLKYQIDLIAKGDEVIDLKLVGRSMDKEEIQRSYQGPAYSAVFKVLFGRLPKAFTLLATVKNKVPIRDIQSIVPTDERIEWFMKRVQRAVPVMEAIRIGGMLPTPAPMHPKFLSQCTQSSCGFFATCEFAAR